MVLGRAGKVYPDGRRVDVRIRMIDDRGRPIGYSQRTLPLAIVKPAPSGCDDPEFVPA
jgi:hypothetical protein